MMARGSSIDFSAQPPSPALTNPDLILPFNQELLGFAPSPPRNRKQPPSPPDSDQTPGIWKSNDIRYNYSAPLRSSPPRIGVSTLLHPVLETEITPTRTTATPLPNSLTPYSTCETVPVAHTDSSWRTKAGRRWSNGSGSVHSDDIENMHWPGFEGPSEVDEESTISEEDDSSLRRFVDVNDPILDEPHRITQTMSMEDDPLSRRADMILANAKKRLHAMEGNLRGARNSLLMSAPSSPTSTYHFQHISDSTKERPRYGSAAPTYNQARMRYRVSPQFSESGHNRMVSDGSSAMGIPTSRGLAIPVRPSSALGSFSKGLTSLERATSLRGVRSQQDMRDSRLQNWIEESSIQDNTAQPVTADAPHSRTASLESDKRPASAAGSLRSQMDELKGRISSLKARAYEDRVKRLSSPPNRTPSPLSHAEKTYTGSEPYKIPAFSTDRETRWNSVQSPRSLQVGAELISPSRNANSNSNEDVGSLSQSALEITPKYAESTYEDAEEALSNIQEEQEPTDDPSTPSTATLVTPVLGDEQKVLMGPQDPTDDELGHSHPKTVIEQHRDVYEHDDLDLQSLDGQSEYFEAPVQIAERHEDRADAFDYQNFFLHSAMGTYSRDRSGSFSSEGSNETTRPASPRATRPSMVTDTSDESEYAMPVLEASLPPSSVRSGFARLVEASPGIHRRSQSVESISTVASFQTATEGGSPSSDDISDDGNDPLEAITRQLLSPPVKSPILGSPTRLVDSVVHFPLPDGVDLRPRYDQKPHAGALVKVLLQGESKDVPPHDLELLEGLIGTLQTVVSRMQNQPHDYDRRLWRRRIDAARKALESE